ncbi:MAG: DUF4230 domain-containing protein [Candidatus Aminicenantes bacterium]
MSKNNQVLTLVAVGIFLIVNFGCGNGKTQQVEEFFNVEKEVSLPENPGKAFSPPLDYEKITDSISKVNLNSSSQDYPGFSQSVKTIHEEILTYLSESLKLPEHVRKEVLERYRDYHETFSRDYYQQLAEQNNSTLASETQSFITYDTVMSAQHFTNILSANICNLSGFIITLATTGSAEVNPVGMFLGKPCRVILNYLLKPIAEKIRRAAVIKDYTISKVSLKSHIRDMIAELGTIRDSYVTDFNERYRLELILGLGSTAKLSVHARSTVKAGFKLHRYFQLNFNHTQKEIIMALPEPEILSNEVKAQIVNMKNGLLVRIDKDKLNDLNDKIRRWGFETAIKSGVLDNAKKNVELLLETIFQPIILATDPDYKIVIDFKYLPGQQNRIRSVPKNHQ